MLCPEAKRARRQFVVRIASARVALAACVCGARPIANLTFARTSASITSTLLSRRCSVALSASRAQRQRRQGKISRELARAVEAILKGLVDPETLRPPVRALEAERGSLAAEAAAGGRHGVA